ncbi:MAG: hypothetical protein RJA70_3556 [Pseudomonadota bacterium]|jgi:predicted ATP-dependent serine protease
MIPGHHDLGLSCSTRGSLQGHAMRQNSVLSGTLTLDSAARPTANGAVCPRPTTASGFGERSLVPSKDSGASATPRHEGVALTPRFR